MTEGRILVVEEAGITVDNEELGAGTVGMLRASHGEDAAHVGLGVELGLDLVTGATCTRHAAGAWLGVRTAALNHETLDDAVKGGAVIEAFFGELKEVLDGLRGDLGPELDREVAGGGVDDGAGRGGGCVFHGRVGGVESAGE